MPEAAIRDWRNDASCAGLGSVLWFPETSDADTSDARRICSDCPVRWECGAFALASGETHGIWAGYWLSKPKELAALRREIPGYQAPPPSAAECTDCGVGYIPTASDSGKCWGCVRGLRPAAPVRDYVKQLHEWLNYTQIAALAGTTSHALASLMNRPRQYMDRDMADALMAIPPLAVMR